MKIAGRKNDGAWFRTNKAISLMNETDKTNLVTFLGTESLFVDSYYNDMVALAAECGIAIDEMPADRDAFLSALIHQGIPRQVWQGRLTFTTYSKVEGKYVPNYTASALSFANELRGFLKRYLHARRQIRDVFDLGSALQGNPGGLPDAIEGT